MKCLELWQLSCNHGGQGEEGHRDITLAHLTLSSVHLLNFLSTGIKDMCHYAQFFMNILSK